MPRNVLHSLLAVALLAMPLAAETALGNWQMQDAVKVSAPAAQVSSAGFHPDNWYKATVPGTVLTTLVDNKVYPEPLYGENMRAIPESLNKTNYWYRTTFAVPAADRGKHIWLNFAGINYQADVWINGHNVGTIKGAFIRGTFDITAYVKPGSTTTLAVLVHPQPHPGTPIEHNLINGIGKNGGITAIDGPTFLSTIGWDWLPGVRDRDTGIWLPVTLTTTGDALVQNPFVESTLSDDHSTADLTLSTTLKNLAAKSTAATLTGTITAPDGHKTTFQHKLTLNTSATQDISLNSKTIAALHLEHPQLWWPNGYGPQNLYTLTLALEAENHTLDQTTFHFGVRKITYEVPDNENLTISVNGVKVMVRGGDWGLDDGLKRIPYERLDAQFHMHALAHMNMIRNWVGQSTSPDFYELADKYGILLWDEFFQPNPGDGPNVTDYDTYLANVTDKVLRFRNHPSIAVWCARNEGYPPKDLDNLIHGLMTRLDPSRLYQSNSADGRGVSSHGPYYWRSPRYFYSYTEAFKTEVGSVSVPTLESIQGMMPQKDWETINDDWAQHDMARGAQRGNFYPFELAKRYGHIRNLADFARKAQLANYEAFRGMYEGRNAKMFKETTGVLTWMSHPAQPSFVWQLYHYDLDPNASLYAVAKAGEPLHIQWNQSTGEVQIVNNHAQPTGPLHANIRIYTLGGKLNSNKTLNVANVAASTTANVVMLPSALMRDQNVYFVQLNLTDAAGKLRSTNFYWDNVAQDDYTALDTMPTARITVTTALAKEGDTTRITATLTNPTQHVALMTHLQLHRKSDGQRILPAFYADNYISLAPGESRITTIDVHSSELANQSPVLYLDGYNIDVEPSTGAVPVQLNLNAQPGQWPATNIVPDKQ